MKDLLYTKDNVEDHESQEMLGAKSGFLKGLARNQESFDDLSITTKKTLDERKFFHRVNKTKKSDKDKTDSSK